MSDAPKRALLTGGTGFIGANLARRLVKDGHEVHLLLRPSEARWRLAGLEGALAVHEAALEERERVEEIVKVVGPQWVFHLAAYGCYPVQTDVQTIVRTNYNGTVNLVEACLEGEFETFVNAGSSSEYGYKDHPPTELELAEPNSHYAATKAAATLYCRFAATRAARQITTLRLYSVYGPWEEPTRLMPVLVRHAMRGELPPLASPATARDYVYVDDAVEAFLLAARTKTDMHGAVLNIGTGTQTSLRELVRIVRRQLRVREKPSWGSMQQRQWDTETWVADPRLAQAAIGWKATFNLEEGVRELTDWFRGNPSLGETYDLSGTRQA